MRMEMEGKHIQYSETTLNRISQKPGYHFTLALKLNWQNLI